ncbi:hypothetical protein LWF15_00325 [Kineosporia rhizophila]|uniref:hypothetical protein n=1 Tax=Kineosporia TaxID=49184 RepID=UPI001E469D16|nr:MULTISPECIES: hypothetical protein [Kineosporia]MCE0533949.1 hypothetical protein [Kineosporia rhizophila]GLY13489.1 hypothetical protein Kisp01_05050 [Kineosporia sp. NBRC 101677]
MSVTVILARHNGHGRTSSADFYNDAQNIEITDAGALTVGCGWHENRVVVGVYPAGGWLTAYVDADREWRDSDPPRAA